MERLLGRGARPGEGGGGAGLTPLHHASRGGHVGCCLALLRAGADAGARSAGGATPLHRAAYMGHADVVKILLRHGSPSGARDCDGLSPADKARARGHAALALLLDEAEAQLPGGKGVGGEKTPGRPEYLASPS